MEFHEKLQELRKQKGLTQEQLADVLFVSRTAVSKWESGRGFPNLDSLKALSQYYAVSLDDLLSNEELLVLAESDRNEAGTGLCRLVFGLLDCCVGLLLFLPLFAHTVNGTVCEVSLFGLTALSPYMRLSYAAVVILTTVFGVITLALQNCRRPLWEKLHTSTSLILSIIGVLLCILGRQPYAAVFFFVFPVIKTLLLLKQR